jgi:integrase
MTNRATIARLTPGQSITIEGVEIERRHNGDIAYWSNFSVGGRRVHELLGLQSRGMNRRRARAHVERKRLEIREGRLELTPKGRRRPLDFATAAGLYLAELVKTGGKNIKRKRQQLVQRLIPVLGQERLSGLTRTRLEAYRQQRRAAGASDASINREMAVVSHMLTIATDLKWIAVKPCRVPKVIETELPREILSPEEQRALLAAAAFDRDCYIFIAMLLDSGMRHREALRVRYEDIRWDDHSIVISVAKAGGRRQPISPWLRDLLRREQEMSADSAGWIFPTRRPELDPEGKGPGHRTSMSEPFAKVAKAALGRHVWPHLLRHTVVTELLDAGASISTTKAISGHRTTAMLLRYAQTSDGKVKHAMQQRGRSLPPVYRDTATPAAEPARPMAKIVAFSKR